MEDSGRPEMSDISCEVVNADDPEHNTGDIPMTAMNSRGVAGVTSGTKEFAFLSLFHHFS